MARWSICILLFIALPASALELQGFLTKTCERKTGLMVHADGEDIDFINLDGHLERINQKQVQALYVFDVIASPFSSITVDEAMLPYMRGIYLEDTREPSVYAFPTRFIEDLLLFYSIDGKTHVQTYSDIFKIREAPRTALGVHKISSSKPTTFSLNDESGQCGQPAARSATMPTRILADPIAIDEFVKSFAQGLERLESFEERTYLYPRPFLYPKRSRLGIVFQGAREEPGLNLPVYFQWSTGESYRFQSYTVIGMKNHEFTPTTEPVTSLRTDVKSHIFHAMFIGNVLGLPAGNSTFLKGNIAKLTDDYSVEPSFNYMALMGGDVGPYSLSFGFYYPTFGIRVGDQYREILGSSLSYALSAAYTTAKLRLRVIGSAVKYSSTAATQDDVLTRSGENGSLDSPKTFNFSSYFIRPGIDYEWTDRLTTGVDVTLINGNYKENASGNNNSLNFNKITVQGYVQRSFGEYVALNGFINLINKNYDSNFLGKELKKNKQETVFFGSLEFMF